MTDLKRTVKRLLISPELKNEQLILHFGYHKAMTSFFNRVFHNICLEFGWPEKQYNSDGELRKDEILKIAQPAIVSMYNCTITPDEIGIPFRGSHIIRDPRDLLVSGYKYHLWTEEPWANIPMAEELSARLDPGSFSLQDQTHGISYRELLRSVDEVTGYLIELNFRRKHFQLMEDWDYDNPAVFEIRYEDIFNNEEAVFEKLFAHYGFNRRMQWAAMKYVKAFSFSSLKQQGATGSQKHASVGNPSQWRNKLPAAVQDAFRERHSSLLIRLGYEKDNRW